ncbi:hypothetical protein Taro_040660 [Colocasia esculenta]|uniref:Uncharacterized protein n=1 Tax=Colocasia esculenta TaxID=4460 RepID=A0A843WTN5_COLES|nr:hypothetical protein [Colocasia esculenta]
MNHHFYHNLQIWFLFLKFLPFRKFLWEEHDGKNRMLFLGVPLDSFLPSLDFLVFLPARCSIDWHIHGWHYLVLGLYGMNDTDNIR